MTRIDVDLGARSYPILIEEGLLDDAARHLAPYARGGRIAVVTDANVWQAQGERLRAALATAGIALEPIILPPGEASKDWASLAIVTDRLLALGTARSDHIIAFGGGMIGDITGFAAAILKRGCGYIQIPTSLLAMVDASVGGKTAINVAAGKNLIGAFHQPSLVLIDPTTLATLPDRELRAGYAEIVKYGLIGDADFFAWCETNGAALLAGNENARRYAIEQAVRAKAAIVAEDERETSGRRALLNLGHSFAHALEAATGFSGALLHGEAVAIGLGLAFRLSAARGLCPQIDAERVMAHSQSVGLPAALAEAKTPATPSELAALMVNDKKAVDGALRLILARGIGQAFVDGSVSLAEVEAFLAAELGN
ncbi:MAG: 3-dehydroquinate synthase [Pseudomonadota bacterium]|nr:3-dehydroquinate synthase [Pseudomonadota bacterium]